MNVTCDGPCAKEAVQCSKRGQRTLGATAHRLLTRLISDLHLALNAEWSLLVNERRSAERYGGWLRAREAGEPDSSHTSAFFRTTTAKRFQSRVSFSFSLSCIFYLLLPPISEVQSSSPSATDKEGLPSVFTEAAQKMQAPGSYFPVSSFRLFSLQLEEVTLVYPLATSEITGTH